MGDQPWRHAAAVVIAAGFAPSAAAVDAGEQPAGLVLTWQRDPTTTMTIDWHTTPDENGDHPASRLHFKQAGAEQWRAADGQRLAFPFSDRKIHRVELMELTPDTTYRFRVGPFERRYKFTTMPAELNRPLRIAAGGDVRHRNEWMTRTNRRAMEYEPDFIIWGGDLA